MFVLCFYVFFLRFVTVIFYFTKGSAQVSLADFDTKRVLLKWYNVLSFKFMQAEGQHSHSHGRKDKQAANMLPSAASNVVIFYFH